MCHQWVKITETTGYKRQAMGLYDSSPANNPTSKQQQEKKSGTTWEHAGIEILFWIRFCCFSIFTTQFSII